MTEHEPAYSVSDPEARTEFLGRLRDALVQAINGHTITAADAWDILREWDKLLQIEQLTRERDRAVAALEQIEDVVSRAR